jgi:hypothetical protein
MGRRSRRPFLCNSLRLTPPTQKEAVAAETQTKNKQRTIRRDMAEVCAESAVGN